MSYICEFENIRGEKVKLTATGRTYLCYKAHYRRDILADLIKYNQIQQRNINLFSGFEKMEALQDVEKFVKLTEEEQNDLYCRLDEVVDTSEYIIRFIVALVLSAEYPVSRPVDQIINEIPPSWVVSGNEENDKIMAVINTLLPSTNSVKKKIAE